MHIIWTWQFELNDLLTTLTIVGIVAGAGYRLLIVPLLDRIEAQRNQDSIEFTNKWNALFDTLGDLKDEMKQSRAERTESAATFMMLITRLESMEKRINELREELHDHISAHK